MKKKDFSPTVYKFKDSVMEHVENSNLFESYLKTKDFTSVSAIYFCVDIYFLKYKLISSLAQD